jgi:hypothetical protein
MGLNSQKGSSKGENQSEINNGTKRLVQPILILKDAHSAAPQI